MLNTLFTERFSIFNSINPDNAFKTYMRWVRKSPHIMGFGNIIATDILSDEVKWEPVDNRSSGRNRVRNSQMFWEVNKGNDVLESTIYDMLFLGVGFNWIGKLNEEEVKEKCRIATKEYYSNFGVEMKEDFIEYKATQIYEKVARGEFASLVKKYRQIPASTMKIKNNKYEITKFVQMVGTDSKEFKTDEVIMMSLIPLDGKLYPYPPMESLLSEVYLLWPLTQNYISLFENGGSPDKVFVLPKEIAGSKNHRYLIETLRKYKKIQNKHGNLVFTGDLNISDLMNFDDKMEYKDLGLYLVGVLAMFYGVPVGRIPFLIGKSATGGDSGGLADSGYWRKISVWQSKIEGPLNIGLWIPFFGTRMRFSRGYKQDEIRETQNEMNKNSIAEQRIRLGLWTSEAAGKYLNIDPSEVKKAQAEKEKRDAEIKSGMLNQNQDNNDNIMKEPDAKLKNKVKQATQVKKQQEGGGKVINV